MYQWHKWHCHIFRFYHSRVGARSDMMRTTKKLPISVRLFRIFLDSWHNEIDVNAEIGTTLLRLLRYIPELRRTNFLYWVSPIPSMSLSMFICGSIAMPPEKKATIKTIEQMTRRLDINDIKMTIEKRCICDDPNTQKDFGKHELRHRRESWAENVISHENWKTKRWFDPITFDPAFIIRMYRNIEKHEKFMSRNTTLSWSILPHIVN